MTIKGWLLFGSLAVMVIILTALYASSVDSQKGSIISAIIGGVVILIMLVGFLWFYNNTESGQRAFKSQESNFNGGLYRTVTVYGYSGDEIESWTGKFDVTENDQETWFDIDGKRVIIQGGIIINEEQEERP